MVENKSINVLLVDDEDDVLNVLGELIENSGWKCFKAPTGEIALDIIKRNDVDVVVLDLDLPKMKGFDVFKQIKVLKPKAKVIILTGLGYEKEEIDKAVKLGAAGYVGKAMPVKNVIAAINRALGQS